jgi:hypothetical protein
VQAAPFPDSSGRECCPRGCSSVRRGGESCLIGEITDPEGRRVVLLLADWLYATRQSDRRLHIGEVLSTVNRPDLVVGDPSPCRVRYYRRAVGISRWLFVVVRYEQGEGRIYNAFPRRRLPVRDRLRGRPSR